MKNFVIFMILLLFVVFIEGQEQDQNSFHKTIQKLIDDWRCFINRPRSFGSNTESFTVSIDGLIISMHIN